MKITQRCYRKVLLLVAVIIIFGFAISNHVYLLDRQHALPQTIQIHIAEQGKGKRATITDVIHRTQSHQHESNNNSVRRQSTKEIHGKQVHQHEPKRKSVLKRQHKRQEILRDFCDTHESTQKTSPSDSLLVSDKYHALWCNIPKVACTTIKWKIANLSGKPVPNDPSIHSADVLKKYGLRWLSSYTAEQQEERLTNYYKFIFVRHPLLRVLSAYKQKFIQGRFNENEVNQELRKIRRPMENLQQKNLQFNEFLWLITKSSMRNNEHWLGYEHKCMPCDINYDFIGNLETFNDDFSHILTKVFNVSAESETKGPKYGQSHAMKVSLATGWQYIDTLAGSEQQNLYNHCEHDAQMFGYSLDDIMTKDTAKGNTTVQ